MGGASGPAFFERVVPSGVVVVQARDGDEVAPPHAIERAAVAAATSERRREFAAGRACARRALATFGIGDVSLPVGERGAPVWPPGFVGSITHIAGFCAAAVTLAARYRSIGIDVARIDDFDASLERLICTPRERARVERGSDPERRLAAASTFSAKEAFYKCQFPLTGRWLEFGDVEISFAGDAFSAAPLVPIAALGSAEVPGRIAVENGLVATCCAARA